MKTRSVLLAAAVALAGLGMSAGAGAQTPNQPAATQPKVNLTLEQRFTIKELIKDLNVQPAPASSDTTVGDTVPSSIKLNPMPADVAAKVPQVKSHLFFLAGDKVVIVDPKENKIVDAFN
jgi:hypothetical protein